MIILKIILAILVCFYLYLTSKMFVYLSDVTKKITNIITTESNKKVFYKESLITNVIISLFLSPFFMTSFYKEIHIIFVSSFFIKYIEHTIKQNIFLTNDELKNMEIKLKQIYDDESYEWFYNKK